MDGRVWAVRLSTGPEGGARLDAHEPQTMEPFLLMQVIGVPAIVAGGVLLHFLYEWSGHRRPIALLWPVNESVWENLKMPYWPLLVVTCVESTVLDAA